MKIYLTLFVASIISFSGGAQTTTLKPLSSNNADAVLADGGIFFNDPDNQNFGYSVPNGSLISTIYSMSFWYGGLDINGQLKLSAQLYEQFDDQFEGPLTVNGTATADVSGAWETAIFEVSKSEIDFHIANYMTGGYVPTQSIALWPGNGDVVNGFANDLAPYVDVDSDGIYDPLAGDYPCIRGDHAVYIIMNDKAGVHASGGDPIGIEMHYMFYEYETSDDINNTTFVYGKVINRGTQTIQDFKMSTFLDADLGNYSDDYIGSDSTRNLMFFYNGDNMDEPSSVVFNSYMEAPPAVGIMSLTHDLESAGITGTGFNNPIDYWNVMNAKDPSGTNWTNPVTMATTNFQYASEPGSANDTESEFALGNPPGDRRGIATVNLGTLTPNATHEFDYAVIYNRDTVDNIDNASGLLAVADFVQNFFDATVANECLSSIASLNEIVLPEFSIYPNPSKGNFTVLLQSDFNEAQVRILDLSGRVVLNPLELSSKETDITVDQPSGIYILQLIVDRKMTMNRIIVE